MTHRFAFGAKLQEGGLFEDGPVHVYLGIDQSYSGFAVTAFCPETDGYATWCYRGKGKGVDRLLDIERWLTNILETLDGEGCVVRATALEGYAFGSQMAHMLGELGGIVKRTLREYYAGKDAQYPWLVPPTVLKKYVTGKGNAAKAEMLLGVYKKWGVEFRDDNMADSFGLAYIAAGKHEFEYQAEALAKLAEPDKGGGLKNRECQ